MLLKYAKKDNVSGSQSNSYHIEKLYEKLNVLFILHLTLIEMTLKWTINTRLNNSKKCGQQKYFVIDGRIIIDREEIVMNSFCRQWTISKTAIMIIHSN